MAKKISAKDLVTDIRSGMDDDGLMRKYEISEQGLQRLFEQLLEKGLMTEADLSSRPPKPPQVIPKQSKSEDITLQNLFGDWWESKKTLILLLIFATPIGVYGLYKTSVFSKKTKAWVAILTVVLAIAAIKPAIQIWLVSVVGIGAYALYRLLPFGRAARIAISVVVGMTVVGMIAPFIDKDSGKSRAVPAQPPVATEPAPQPVQAKIGAAPQPSQSKSATSTPQPAPVASSALRPDARTAKDCAKKCDDQAMSEDDPVSAYEKCITKCPESVRRNYRCLMGCSDKCGRMKDLHRSSGEDWDSFQARVKKAGKEIPECLNKCAADCNREHYGE